MKKHVQYWATASLLWLAGCATTPELSEPPAIESSEVWSVPGAGTESPAPWLSTFNDPELEALVAEALRNHAGLERVSAVLAQSIAEARIAGADLRPSAGLGLGGSRQKISTFGPNSTGGVVFENYDLSLNLSWEIDLWGRLRDLSSAALARIESNQAELYAAQLSIAAQVSKAWFNLIEARTQVREAEQTAEAYRETVRTLESRFRRGLSQGLELRQIRSIAASAEADLGTRRRALDSAIRSLEVLLGRYPGAELHADRAALPQLPEGVPSGLPADLIQRRPDLIAAERRLAAADRDVRASQKDLLPRISLTSSGGTSSQEFGDLLDGDFSVWTLAGNLSQPIFQGGRILANVDRSKSIRDQARAIYRDAALRAFLEVETALTAETYLKNEYTALQSAAAEANAAEAIAWDRYRNGTGDFLNVLDTQRTAAAARSRLLAIQNALLQNRVDLHLALGGPFEPPS